MGVRFAWYMAKSSLRFGKMVVPMLSEFVLHDTLTNPSAKYV